MNNPWENIRDEQPYVAPGDEIAIQRWNQEMREKRQEAARIHKEFLAEPYLGNPDAPVVLLNSNPGYDSEEQAHQEPDYRSLSFDNLRHSPLPYPLFWLDPVPNGITKLLTGMETFEYRWWYNHVVRPLLQPYRIAEGTLRAQTVQRAIAQNVFVVNSCAYHAQALLRGDALNMPSQVYSEYLVARAMARGALVLVLRFDDYWLPILQRNPQHPKTSVVVLTDPNAAFVSSNSWPPDFTGGGSFEDYLAALDIATGTLTSKEWPTMTDTAMRALMDSPFGSIGRNTRQFLRDHAEYQPVFEEIYSSQEWSVRHDPYRDFERTYKKLAPILGLASHSDGSLWWAALFHAVCDVYGGTDTEWCRKFSSVKL